MDMKIFFISISIIITLLIILSIIKYVKWHSKIRIESYVDKTKIIKVLLNKCNLDQKYITQIQNNIDIIKTLDNLDYSTDSFYIKKLEDIAKSEEKIDLLYGDLQSSSIKNKFKILWFKNEISKENNLIENYYSKMISKMLKDKNKITKNLLNEIVDKLSKVRYKIQKSIALEEEIEIETWKSEIDRLDNYMYLDSSFKKIISEIK